MILLLLLLLLLLCNIFLAFMFSVGNYVAGSCSGLPLQKDN